MTTELEKQFFEVFEIPKIFKTIINTGDLDTNYEEIQAPTLKELYEEALFDFATPIYFSWFKRSKRWWEEYPEITDKHYLELICLYVSTNDSFKCFADTEKINFRNQILEKYIANKRFFDKHQVQAIFEGER